MSLAELTLDITNHAYEQYCIRVDPIDRNTLHLLCMQKMRSGYDKHDGEYIRLAGVWWVYSLKENNMSLLTCYGRTTANLPEALKWAQRHNDNIDLKNISGIGVLS